MKQHPAERFFLSMAGWRGDQRSREFVRETMYDQASLRTWREKGADTMAIVLSYLVCCVRTQVPRVTRRRARLLFADLDGPKIWPETWQQCGRRAVCI